MILTGKEDLRVQKTIEAIQSNFHNLILEKEYSNITVKELCERARINKKTFYTYYETLDDLLLEMQIMISSEYTKRIENYTLKDIDKQVREFFIFSEEKGEFYEKITCGGAYTHIRQQMIDKVNNNRDSYPELQKLSKEDQEIIRTFLSESLLAIYRNWIEGGKKLPVEKVIELTTSLLVDGVQRYMK
ncbi:Transcriptional regulator, TetR family [Lachnospiraceae bacterium TWA4]|nr:Transcriptional regulator, TetR family [Lachnospiraceae bacterium TWA4]